jgi:aminomethyltransferase
MSPTLDVAIALGYVETSYATEGTPIEILVRNRPVRATITDRRFLETNGEG